MKPILTNAEYTVLKAMAGCPVWMPGAKRTVVWESGHGRVHTRTALRLIERGLAKRRAELIDGTVVTGTQLARYLSYWKYRYTITPKGRRALKGRKR